METKPTKEVKTSQTKITESKTIPFLIVETSHIDEETKEEFLECKIAVQNNIVSEQIFASVEEAEEYISCKPWELIVNLICLTIELNKEYEKSLKK